MLIFLLCCFYTANNVKNFLTFSPKESVTRSSPHAIRSGSISWLALKSLQELSFKATNKKSAVSMFLFNVNVVM